MILQQGDVILESTNEEPQGKQVARKDGKLVLAEGEVTGHSHTISAPDAKMFETTMGNAMDFLLLLDSPTTIRHQEHKAIKVPAGKWKVRRVKEYDHFAEEARVVRD
jgi:hypothetical protein